MELTKEFKQKVAAALLQVRENYGGSDKAFAKQFGVNAAIYSRLKKGETEGILKDMQWLTIGRRLDVRTDNQVWKIAKTDVFKAIEEDIMKCKEHSISLMFVDECEIGKTTTAKYLSKTLKNCFYIDCSQWKSKTLFVRAFAQTLGLESNGKIADIKADIKYYLNQLEQPVVIFDEAGDLEYRAFLELKEFWNATESSCGFYMLGADGLREKITRGIANKKVGFRENFSRFGSKYMSVVPTDRDQRIAFYNKMLTEVLNANVKDRSVVPGIVKKCLTSDLDGHLAGIRRAKNLLKITQ